MQHLEHKLGDVTFVRVDSDTVDNLVQKDELYDEHKFLFDFIVSFKTLKKLEGLKKALDTGNNLNQVVIDSNTWTVVISNNNTKVNFYKGLYETPLTPTNKEDKPEYAFEASMLNKSLTIWHDLLSDAQSQFEQLSNSITDSI